MPKGRVAEFPPEAVRGISLAVYKLCLDADSGKGAAGRVKKEVGEETLRNRAAAYDSLTRKYMRVMNWRS